jgi:hypothetical protein
MKNMRIEASDIGVVVVNFSSTGSAPLPRDLEIYYFECRSNPVKLFDCRVIMTYLDSVNRMSVPSKNIAI